MIGTAVAGVVIYALMWLGYAQNWIWLTRGDAWALQPMHRLGVAHTGWVSAWNIFCTVLGDNAFRLLALVVIVVALIRRRIRIAIFLLITVEFSALVTQIAKTLADRPRPITAMVAAHGASFPSGHALGVTVAVLALLTVALPVVGASWRRWLLAVGIMTILAVGVGRVALNVHHPSDVIAGWALGYAYFVACLLIVPPLQPGTRATEVPAAPCSAR